MRGWAGVVTSYIWHSMDEHAEWPPFSALPGIWLAPFCRQKVYNWPNGIWKAPLFLSSMYMHIFFTQRFLRLLILLVFNELTALFVWPPAINGYKKSTGSIWMGHYFRWSSIWMGPFFQRPGTYMNRVGFEILARTPVPKLPHYENMPIQI